MAWQDTLNTLKADAEKFLSNAEAAVVAEVKKIEPVLEADLEAAISYFGNLAISLIAQYAGSLGAGMTGLEKQKSVSLRLQEHAVGNNKTLSFANATSVTQNSYDALRLAHK